MPSKKKKYNARFPAGRIKKIMQSDEEVGKVAQAVPIIISRTLELFVESLLTKTLRITNSRNAKTLSPSHMKQCIMSENRFDFLRELVKNIPDISVADETGHDGDGITSPQSSDLIINCGISNSSGIGITVGSGTIPLHSSSSSSSSSSSTSSTSSIDNSMQPYDLSINKSSTSSTTATKTANGNSLRNGGLSINIKCATATTTATTGEGTISSPQSASSNSSTEFRAELKRQWDNVHACRKQLSEKNSTAIITETAVDYSNTAVDSLPSVIQHTSDTDEDGCTPAKLARMDSLPNMKNSEKNSVKRLQHQSKSVPCSPKELTKSSPSSSLLSSSTTSSSSSSSTYQIKSLPTTPTLPPTIPAPILSTDNICSKPIVKIDYSNIALHDNELSSINDNDSNSDNKTITPTVNITINPVINIDLSNIKPLPTTVSSPLSFTTSISSTSTSTSSLLQQAIEGKSKSPPSLSPPIIKSQQQQKKQPAKSKIQKSSLQLNKSSNLELDEDYDDI